MPSTHNYSDIFLSYSRRHLDFTHKLEASLRQHPAIQEIWVDWEDIPQSADWRAEIEAGIEGADTFLFIITPESVRSQECLIEIELAVKMQKRIVPVVYIDVTDPEDQSQIHPAIKSPNWFFMRDEANFEEQVNELVKVIKTDQAHVNNHTRYLVRSTEWIGHGCENSYLLTGVEIDIAERWLQEAEDEDKDPIPTDEQRDYIETSRWQDEQHKADVARREEVIRRSQRVTRVLRTFLVLAVIAIIASVIAIFSALQETRDANAQVADSNTQVATANTQIAGANTQISEARIQINFANSQSTEAAGNLDESEADGYDYRMIGQALLNQGNENEALAFAYEAIGNPDPPLEIFPVFYEIASRPQNRMTLDAYDSGVSYVAFSPDGSVLASVGCSLNIEDSIDCEKVLSLWDANSGEFTQTVVGDVEPVAVSFSPVDSSLLAVSYKDGSISLLDTTTGDLVSTGTGHRQLTLSIAFNADGTMLASSSFDRTIRLWNIEDRQIADSQVIDTMAVNTGLAFSPNGSLLASATMEGRITIWDTASGQELASMDEHSSWVNSIAFSPDGIRVVSASFDKTLKLWNLETNGVQTLNGHSDWVSDVAFSPDGETIASSSFDATVRLWNAHTGAEIVTLRGHDDWVMRVVFRADGRMLASASFDGTIKLWDSSPGAEFGTLSGHTGDVSTLAFHPGSEVLVSGSFDNTVRIIDIASGDVLASFEDHSDRIAQIAISPDGRLLASASTDNSIIIRDMVSGNRILEMNELGHDGDVLDLTFTSDSQTLVSAGADGSFKFWNLADGNESSVINPGGIVRAIAVSPDRSIIATAGDDNLIRLWSLTDNALDTNTSTTLEGHGDVIHALAFNSDGTLLASASQDGTIRRWNVETRMQFLEPLRGHEGAVTGVDFSVDDLTIASSGQDGTIRLWDAQESIELLALDANEGSANQVVFSPNGRYLASAHASGVVKLWNLGSLSFMRQWLQENRYIREFSCTQRNDFNIHVTCDDEGNFPTRTPFPTTSPIAVTPLVADWTAEPTVENNLADTVITPYWIPTHTPTITPSPTPTATLEAEVTEEGG